MNGLITFNSSEFGEIRTVEMDGQPWFVGKMWLLPLGTKIQSTLSNPMLMKRTKEGGGKSPPPPERRK